MLLQNSLSNVIKGIFINIPRSSDIYWLSPLCERWCFRSSNLNEMSELLQGLCICQIEKNMRPVITHEKVVKLLWERISKASWIGSWIPWGNSWPVIYGHWWESIESLIILRTEVHGQLRKKAMLEKDMKKEKENVKVTMATSNLDEN